MPASTTVPAPAAMTASPVAPSMSMPGWCRPPPNGLVMGPGAGQVEGGLAGVAQREDGQGRGGDAVVDVALHVGPALGGRAVDDEVVDHAVGNGGNGRLAVARRPGLPHRAEVVGPAQPLVEGL